MVRALIEAAVRERRFRARAVRIDSTVIEADVKYPTDAGLAAHGVRSLAREGRKLAAKLGQPKARARDRSRSMGRRLRAISRTIRRRSGEAKAEVLALTEQTGELLEQSVSGHRGGSRHVGTGTRPRPTNGLDRERRVPPCRGPTGTVGQRMAAGQREAGLPR